MNRFFAAAFLFGLVVAAAPARGETGDPIVVYRDANQAWVIESFAGKTIRLGGKDAGDRPLSVTVDGLHLTLVTVQTWKRIGDAKQPAPTPSDVDVLCFEEGIDWSDLSDARTDWLRQSGATWFLTSDSKAAERLVKNIDGAVLKDGKRGVLAMRQVAAPEAKKSSKPAIKTHVVPTLEPLPDELESLFVAMEKACAASQQTFASLSAKQMNFRPPNGTHTPRWNAEHMMGRELLFFSQIYHAIDPAVPIYNWNPKQMPPEYVADQPAWSGRREAERMEQVSRFVRRYADWLRDVDLDARAPGSRWTLRGLLRQMERHYNEHTANVVKKQKLPEWPRR
ncbi:MAG: DinB family protein [Planctomycetota bacterium]